MGRSWKDERGQALVILVLVIPLVLLPGAALVIEGGNIRVQRQHAQNMADSAALAAASRLTSGTP